ncbi:MAG TPA: hypothetical protein VF459_14965 [Caulobacteraceae bacterium]
MSITGVSQSSGQTALNTSFQQRNDAFNSLDQALSSGDLASAQSAFSTLQSLAPQGGKGPPPGGGPGGQDDPMAKDMAAVSSALQSGDLAAAQSAFAALKQDMAAHKGQRHNGQPQDSQTAGATDNSATSSTSGVIDTSNGVDITA